METHEIETERFFERGIENYGAFHGNYLNFGLWEKGITEYVKAAENLISRVAKKINLNENSVLLDVGCGMGAQNRFFLENYGCKLIKALDLTRKHIELAKSMNKHENLEYVVGNACQLPYEENTFTHITGIEAPANFNTREKFFVEANRVLKKDGMIGLSDFILAREPKNRLELKMLKFGARLWHISFENVDNIDSYKEKMEVNGFTDVNIDVVSNDVYPGYYQEQMRPETRKQLYKIRGQVVGRASHLIDFFTDRLYQIGLIGYVLVSARKE